MQIRTDVNQILNQRANVPAQKNQSPPTIRQDSPNRNSTNQLQGTITNNLQMERTMSEALTIAQSSQHVLQKAMVVSSRLKSIAAQAMTTGKVDTNELQVTLSDIQSTMQSVGEQIIAPPQNLATNVNEIPELPQIGNDINNVINAAQNTLGGTIPNEQEINTMDLQLQEHAVSLNDVINQLENNMNTLGNQYSRGENFNSPEITANTANMIGENPTNALAVQGNINRTNVQKIFAL